MRSSRRALSLVAAFLAAIGVALVIAGPLRSFVFDSNLHPVVAGQIRRDAAASLFEDPESVRARRAAAHAIVAVDDGARDSPLP